MAYREIVKELVTLLSPLKLYPIMLPKEANGIGNTFQTIHTDTEDLMGVGAKSEYTREYIQIDTYDIVHLTARSTANSIYNTLINWNADLVVKRTDLRIDTNDTTMPTTGKPVICITQEFMIAYKNSIETP